jgi:predicted outer membrane repeat protein
VDNLGDDGSLSACTVAANDCSLRGAVSNASGSKNDITIDFDGSLFEEVRKRASESVIRLSGSALQIVQDYKNWTRDYKPRTITIKGLGEDTWGQDSLSVVGDGKNPVFAFSCVDIDPEDRTKVIISGFRVMGNELGSRKLVTAAGIKNNGCNLTLDQMKLTNSDPGIDTRRGNVEINRSFIYANKGSGILITSGKVEVYKSQIGEYKNSWGDFSAGNTGANGGGINCADAEVVLINSTVKGNNARRNGGGIYSNSCKLVLESSNITNNFAEDELSGHNLWSGSRRMTP